MIAQVRELSAGDVVALRTFFAEVPQEDRTFFKEDVEEPGLAERWCGDPGFVRMVAVDAAGGIIALAALVPGIGRSHHVADLRLVVSGRARRQRVGGTMARGMLLSALEHDFTKVTVEVAADTQGPIEMFRGLGFRPEALLRDQLRDPDGALHDVVILAHDIDETWAAMETVGIAGAVG
jgi:ribosomal protein S18 acetylase RimI-like enzyme